MIPDNLVVVNKFSEGLPGCPHLLLIDKPAKKTSFDLVAGLRRASGVQKVGHAGTLDPFATGVMLLLIEKAYTRLSPSFIGLDKEYLATVYLGIATNTYDCEGQVTRREEHIPSLQEVESVLSHFQGTVAQIPPMFSAKKRGGKKLYELARKGIEVEREKIEVTLATELLHYTYPHLELKITCSKGTYIRAIAHDIGQLLATGAHLSRLTRTRSGPFPLTDCLPFDSAVALYLGLRHVEQDSLSVGAP